MNEYTIRFVAIPKAACRAISALYLEGMMKFAPHLGVSNGEERQPPKTAENDGLFYCGITTRMNKLLPSD